MKIFSDFGIEVGHSSGQQYVICPQCSASRKKKGVKCLSVNISEGVWLCHHCSWSGSLNKGVDRREMSRIETKVYKRPQKHEARTPDRLIQYFEQRGISQEIVQANKIIETNIYMPHNEDFMDVIAFPYIKSGEIINYKYRSYDKHFRQVGGAEKVLYGLDFIVNRTAGDDTIIICEGEIDALSFQVAGFNNCVSVPDGAPALNNKNFEAKFEYLENSKEILDGIAKIILAVDNDPPGRKLEEELVRRLGADRCWRIEWPDNCKDANDVLVRHGEFELLRLIDQARPVPVAGLFEVNDFRREIETLYDHGVQGGVSPGWESVARHYRIRTGEFTVLTGVASHGKSAWLDAVMVNIAHSEGWRFTIFSPENQPIQRHIVSLIQLHSGKMFDQNILSRQEKDISMLWLQEHFTFIFPPEDEFTIDAILEKAKTAVIRYGIRGVVIDPWNEVEHDIPYGLTETQYISKALTKIRRFARRHQVHIFLIAHPTKLHKDKNGKYPIPTPNEISGSNNFRNKADCCVTIFREFAPGDRQVQVHIQKIRFRENGSPGVVYLNYDIRSGRYYEQLTTML